MPFPPPPPGTLEKVSIPFSSGSSQPRDQTWVSCIGRKILYHLSRQGSLCKQSRHFIFQLRYSLIAFNMKSFSIVSLFVVVWGSAGPELTRDGVFHELFRMLKNISCYLLLLSSVPKIIPFLTLQQGWKVQICSCFKQCAWGWRYSLLNQFSSVQFSSVLQSCPTLCNPMNHSTPGLPVHHQLPEFTQTHVCRVGDAIQPSHPLSSPSPPAPNPSQHQGLSQWVNSSHEVAKVLEFQLQHQAFQWTPRTDLL